jgi:hypothetical protein
MVDFGGESAPVICREDVIRSKTAAGRLRDQRDLRNLKRRKE